MQRRLFYWTYHTDRTDLDKNLQIFTVWRICSDVVTTTGKKRQWLKTRQQFRLRIHVILIDCVIVLRRRKKETNRSDSGLHYCWNWIKSIGILIIDVRKKERKKSNRIYHVYMQMRILNKQPYSTLFIQYSSKAIIDKWNS